MTARAVWIEVCISKAALELPLALNKFLNRLATACVLVCMPAIAHAQSITLGGSANVAAAEDFATRAFQDPWDMNQRTDFGWFLYGADYPTPDVTVHPDSFSNGFFHGTTGTQPNLFLLETGNPFAARLGKTGMNYPIDANLYKLVAIRMWINSAPPPADAVQAVFGWNRNHLWDGTQTTSNIVNLSPGWRTYFVDLSTHGTQGGSTPWNGLIRSLQFTPAYLNPYEIYIDWIRLVNIDAALCRPVTWSGFTAGQFDLYLSDASGGSAPATLLARAEDIQSRRASAGCAVGAGNTYTFYAGGLGPGTYRVIAKRRSDGFEAPSGGTYVVNAAPTLTVTSPSEEGSADDFATTQLGNPWDMNALTDVERYEGISSASIATIQTESQAGTPLGNTNVLYATSAPAQPGLVGDPILYTVWPPGTTIDPNRYRILTAEFGLPNVARSVNTGSVARIAWRVAGASDSVSDDIIINSRAGANVLDKVIVDMADRTVLPIEQGSQIGWVPGSAATPGIDRFRLDVHEFSNSTPFFVKRIKLAAFERALTGTNYTIRWNASKAGTVTVYRDTDRNPSNGGLTQIGATSAAAGAGQLAWNATVAGQYYIYVVINDGQGNLNGAYSLWPLVVGSSAGPPSTPSGFQILK